MASLFGQVRADLKFHLRWLANNSNKETLLQDMLKVFHKEQKLVRFYSLLLACALWLLLSAQSGQPVTLVTPLFDGLVMPESFLCLVAAFSSYQIARSAVGFMLVGEAIRECGSWAYGAAHFPFVGFLKFGSSDFLIQYAYSKKTLVSYAAALSMFLAVIVLGFLYLCSLAAITINCLGILYCGGDLFDVVFVVCALILLSTNVFILLSYLLPFIGRKGDGV